MEDQFTRTRMLFGKPALDTLAAARVAVFGVGGVGGYVAEVLARSGVGEIYLIDNDRVSPSNINRQILALNSTIGRYKVDVAAERIRDINPHCIVHRYQMFYLPDNADQLDFTQFDYVADCVDTVKAKLHIIERCHRLHIPLISSMGAANKLDATAFRVADINQTQMDPLAKVIRKKLRKLNIPRLKVVYSEEEPLTPMADADSPHLSPGDSPSEDADNSAARRSVPASNAFVPAAAGLIVGGEVVKDLIRQAGTMRITPDEADSHPAAIAAAEQAETQRRKAQQMAQDRENGTAQDDRVTIEIPEQT